MITSMVHSEILHFPVDIDRDFVEVKSLLEHLNMEELRNLFMRLGLSYTTVQNTYHRESINDYAFELIRLWIMGKDYVLKRYPGGATWENLKSALIAEKHHGIAANI